MKALIIGSDPTGHEVSVQTAFEAGGGVLSDIYESALNQTLVDYATTNNYDAIIYSYSGEESYFSLANSNPDIMIFMPSDDYSGDLQQLVLTDLDPSTDDYEFLDNTQSAVSYSNGYIVGQLFSIASQRSCSLQEASIVANLTKDEDGIIDVDSAVAYTGDINLTIGDIVSTRTTGLNSTLVLDLVIDATSYEIEVTKDDVVYETIETIDLSNSYTLPGNGLYSFRYRGLNDDLESEWSTADTIKYPSFDYILLQEYFEREVKSNNIREILDRYKIVIIPDSEKDLEEYWSNDERIWEEATETWDETL